MMETNFTQTRLLTRLLTVLLLSTFGTYSSYAQSCACKESIQVSLDEDGIATVTASMLLADNATCPGAKTVTVMLTPTGNPIMGSPNVNCSHIGKTLYGKVTSGNNSCWSKINVEDKIKPLINCPTRIMQLTCTQMASFVPDYEDNCPGVTIATIGQDIITNNSCSNPALAPNVLKRIVRTYQATDAHGNKSLPCTITFDVTTISSLNDIVMPDPYLVANDTELECDGDWAKLADGNPNPVNDSTGVDVLYGTGVPTLGFLDLYPDPNLYCNLVINFSDTKLPKIGCVTKIMRTWTVIEWSCQNRTRLPYVQIIEIQDTKGPVITGLNDILASTSNHTCEGNITFAAATVTDNCAKQSSITVDITIYPNGGNIPGVFIKSGAPKVANLPVGNHIAIYTAYDDCYNSTTATINVIVEDNTPPVTICDEFATVGLTSDGTAWVPATIFDDGSYDECSLSKMLVRRMNNTSCGDCETPTFPGFKLLGIRNGHYYYTSDHPAEGKIGFKNAKAMGGYGVSLETPAEASWVIAQLTQKNLTDCFTIGLNLNNFTTFPNFKWESGAIFNFDEFFGTSLLIDDNLAYVCVNGNAGPELDFVPNFVPNKYIIEITDPCGWSSYAKFCCSDIGANQMVAFRTIDHSGNYNDCMVSAVIQDKIGPTLTCPADRTVNCDFAYDPNNLRKDFGWPVATDNCENPVITRIDSVNTINSCRIGTIVRRFMVTDRGGRTASCSQTITFRPSDSQLYNGPTSVQWPRDTMIVGCGNPSAPGFLPAVLGKPILTDGACSLVGAQSEDQSFSFNNPASPACFKILRYWTVIDWCQPLDGGGYRTWLHTQEIKVIDNIAPVFAPLAPSVSVDTEDPLCANGTITLAASATDVCTTVLKYSYKIDLGNDGTFLPTVTGNGNSINITSSFPVGKHKIVYSFEDKCGNVTSKEQLFSIVNKKAPSAYVKNGLAINLMDLGGGVGMAEIWATDFDNGSSHPCGYKILLSFTPVTVDALGNLVGTPNLVFDCTDIGKNNVTIYIAVLTPAGDVVQSSVATFIDVQDNNLACDGRKLNVNGKLTTEANAEVQDVYVSLAGTELNTMSGLDGTFQFGLNDAGGNFIVTPDKNDDHLNGVSTLDLVMIQRHILSIDKLNTPYKLIAADITKDGKITAADLVELRKLVLGTTTSFINNRSWRFVDKAFTFQDPTFAQGEAFPEVYRIDNLVSDMITDFVAVKIGDVNGNAKTARFNNGVENRTSESLVLTTDDKSFTQGQKVIIPVNIVRASDINGMQFTINFDASVLSLDGIHAAEMNVNDSNFGFANVKNGTITLSWNDVTAQTFKNGATLFNLTFTAIADGSTNTMMSIGSDITNAEAYDANSNVVNVAWEVSDRSVASGFVLYQNTPNPFKENTMIGFELPSAMNASVTLYDITGKIIKTTPVSGVKGYNAVEVHKADISAGIFYYSLRAGEYTATKKMVVID
ncbi:MAG: T9SS type A sorting domain-containing protein [Saprospiraceae bacterium]|nr:T9SS type A sorting domain-containing protein [Saprospiraceae bacterium]